MTMETIPAPLDAMESASALDEFRIDVPVEVEQLLEQLRTGNALLHLSTFDGVSYTTTLLAQDRWHGIVSFAADARDPRLQSLLGSTGAVVVGYLDSIKLQFDALGLTLAPGARGDVLNAAYPREVFRFQRRRFYRVRPLTRSMATATLALPIASGRMRLRVLDVSLAGVALFLPESAPGFARGSVLQDVLLQLDVHTQLSVGLIVRHTTAIGPRGGGARMGCEILDLSRDDARLLQRYIDITQKQRRALA